MKHNLMRSAVGTLLAALLGVMPAAALAQSEGASGRDEAGASVAARGDSSARSSGTATLSRAVRHGSDESIYVLQERAYSKRGKFEITPLMFTGLNPKFVGYVGGALGATYHIRENFAVEFATLIPAAINGYYSDLVYEVWKYNNALRPQEVDLKQMDYFATLSAQLSALYGKLDLYGIIMDYDFYATVGLGVATTKQVCKPNSPGCSGDVSNVDLGLRNPDDTADRVKLAGSVGGGMRFFFSKMFGLRFEVRDIVYADQDYDEVKERNTTDIRNNIMLFLGLSVLI